MGCSLPIAKGSLGQSDGLESYRLLFVYICG